MLWDRGHDARPAVALGVAEPRAGTVLLHGA